MKGKKLFVKVLCAAYTVSLGVVPIHSVGAASNIVADVDYENYNTTATRIYPKSAISDVHPDLDKGLKYYSAGNFGTESADDMYIVAEEDGNKFMRLYSEPTPNENQWVDREIRVPVNLDGTNSLEVEYRIRKMEGGYGNCDFATLTYYWGEGSWGHALNGKDALSIVDVWTNISNLSSTEWKTIKGVYEPIDGTYKVTFYENGTEKGSKQTGQSALNQIRIAKLYNMSDKEAWYDIDDITVKEVGADTNIAADDFQSYSVELMKNVHPDYSQDNLGYIGDVSYAKTNPECVFVLKDSDSNNKFLRVYNKTGFSSNPYGDGTYDAEVRVPVTLDGTNSVAVEFKIRSMDGSYSNSVMHNFTCWGDGMVHGINTSNTGLTVVDSNPVVSVANLSSTEWTTLKAIYTPQDGVYNVDYYANGELKGTRITGKAALNEIRIIDIYTCNGGESWYDIDDIKVEYNPTTEFTCDGTSLSSTTNVATDIGTITLTFNDNVKADTISGITMTDADDVSVPNFSVSASGNTVVLTFGGLAQGTNYTITVPSTVQSTGGLSVTPATFDFRTISNVIANVDYENYNTTATEIDFATLGNNVHPDYAQDHLGYIGSVSYAETNPESVFVLKDSDSGNKFLRVYNKKNFSSQCYDDGSYDTEVRVPVVLDGTNTLGVSLKVRAMNGTYTNSNSHMFTFWDENHGKMAHGLKTINNNTMEAVDANPVFFAPAPSSEEWTTYKAIYRPENGAYYVDYYVNGQLKGTRTTDAVGVTKVRVISLNNVGTDNSWYDIDDVKVEYNPTAEFTCNGTSLSSTTNVATDIGTITLTFSDNVNAETISGITMTDADGESVPNFSARASANTVVLTFGGLTEGTNYTITIPSTVQSTDGLSVTPAEFKFKTLSNVITSVDYENYETTATEIDFANASNNVHPDYAQDNLGYIGDVDYKETNPESVFVLKDSNSNNKFLRVYNRKNFSSKCYDDGSYDTEVRAAVNLDGTNVIAVELKARAMNGTYTNSNAHMFTFWTNEGKMVHGLKTMNNNSMEAVDASPVFFAPAPSSEAWTTYRAIYRPQNGVYYVDYYVDGQFKGTRTTEAAGVTKVRVISLNNVGTDNIWYDIDDIKVENLTAPKVVSSDIEGGYVSVTKQTIDLYFSVDMNSDTVNDESVKVYCGDTDINAGVMYYPATNHVTLSFADYLSPNTTYRVVFNGAKSAEGVSVNSDFVFTTGNAGITCLSSVASATEGGEAITEIPSSGTVYASATVRNDTGKDGEAVIIIASYDASGRLLSINKNSTAVKAGAELPVSTSLSNVSGANMVRVYLWNGLGTMSPISVNPITLYAPKGN